MFICFDSIIPLLGIYPKKVIQKKKKKERKKENVLYMKILTPFFLVGYFFKNL